MWETVTLEKVCKIISGNSIPAKKKEEYYTDVEGVPYVATKDVGFDGAINYKNGVFIPDEYLSGFKISPAFATLVCAEGGSAGRKIAFSTEECCFVNKLFSLQPNENIIPKFIYYYTLGTEFQSQFKEAMHGLIGGVSLSKIKDFYISIPPLADQQRIVAKLDAAFAEIDKAMQLAYSKEIKIEQLEITLLSNFLNEGVLKSENVKLEDVCLNITDGSHFSPKTVEEGFPYITVRDINDDGIDFANCKFISKESYLELAKNGCSPSEGDVLFSKDGTVGKVAEVKTKKDFAVLSSLAILTPNKNFVTTELLAYILKSQSFLKEAIGQKTGAAIRRIILKNLKKISFKLPSLAHQHSIVSKLDAAFAEIGLAKNAIKRKQANYNTLKSAILAQELQSEAA